MARLKAFTIGGCLVADPHSCSAQIVAGAPRPSHTHTENPVEIGPSNPAKSAAFSRPNLVSRLEHSAWHRNAGDPDGQETEARRSLPPGQH
jgi:hypothetical protein